MLPLMRSDLSIINSIIELKDFVTFKDTTERLASAVSGLRIGNNWKRHKLDTLQSLMGAGADGFLQEKFNLIPLFSDIVKVYLAMRSYKKRLAVLLQDEGKTVTRHWKHCWPEFPDVFEEGGGTPPLIRLPLYNRFWWPPDLHYSSNRRVRYSLTEFHAQVRLTYEFSDLQREFASSLALLDVIGIDLNPVIIWNAIPWSFVVDWVVGVNRWLSDKRIGNMDPKIRVLRYMYSFKRKREITCKVTVTQSGVPVQSILLPSVTETAYHRQSVVPDASLLTTSGISSMEYLLGTSLVVSKRSNHRRVNKLRRIIRDRLRAIASRKKR
jgi:hypothetical protein